VTPAATTVATTVATAATVVALLTGRPEVAEVAGEFGIEGVLERDGLDRVR
jgi:hypothetical protein